MEYISKIRERVERRLALKLLPYMERVVRRGRANVDGDGKRPPKWENNNR